MSSKKSKSNTTQCEIETEGFETMQMSQFKKNIK